MDIDSHFIVNWMLALLFFIVQSLSHVWLFATPWTAARQASLSITNSQVLLKLMSIESVMPSNHLILCCPLLLLPSIFPSIRVFSNDLFGGHKQNFVCTRTQEKGAVTPQETDPESPAEVWVGSALLQGQGQWVRQCMHRAFWRKLPLSSLPPPWFGLRSNNREGTQPLPSQKIGLKIYWAWAFPSEQDLVSPTVSLSHLEASISLLSLSLRGQTGWKPQSQKTNQTDHMDHSLV